MEKKFKVESFAWYGKNKTDTYYTFEEAKIGFRNRIASPNGVPHIIGHIEEYMAEHYPENPPAAFGQLIGILTSLLTDPSYPQGPEDVVLDYFEDEHVEFYLVSDDESVSLYCYTTEDYDGKFPLAEINVFKMDDEEREYFFYLTERRDGMCWSWNYQLSPIGEGEVIDEDDFDGI